MLLTACSTQLSLSCSPGHMNRLKRSANTVLSSKSVEPFCVQRSALEASSYDCLYEEANNLLKNLHFQRMMRHGPESPEPSGREGAQSAYPDPA